MWGPKVAVRPKVAVLVKIAVRPKVAMPAQCHRVMLLQNFLIERVLSYTFWTNWSLLKFKVFTAYWLSHVLYHCKLWTDLARIRQHLYVIGWNWTIPQHLVYNHSLRSRPIILAIDFSYQSISLQFLYNLKSRKNVCNFVANVIFIR